MKNLTNNNNNFFSNSLFQFFTTTQITIFTNKTQLLFLLLFLILIVTPPSPGTTTIHGVSAQRLYYSPSELNRQRYAFLRSTFYLTVAHEEIFNGRSSSSENKNNPSTEEVISSMFARGPEMHSTFVQQVGDRCDFSSDCVPFSSCIEGTCQRYSDYGSWCSDSKPCIGLHCVNNQCRALGNIGDACEHDKQCETNICGSSSGVCEAQKVGSPCSQTAECNSNLFCHQKLKQCVPLREVGQSCHDHMECVGYLTDDVICDSGRCRMLPMELDRCSSDSGCAFGHYCNLATGRCDSRGGQYRPGWACHNGVQCSEGYRCHKNVCVPNGECTVGDLTECNAFDYCHSIQGGVHGECRPDPAFQRMKCNDLASDYYACLMQKGCGRVGGFHRDPSSCASHCHSLGEDLLNCREKHRAKWYLVPKVKHHK